MRLSKTALLKIPNNYPLRQISDDPRNNCGTISAPVPFSSLHWQHMLRKVDFCQNVVKLFVLSIVVFKVILLILTLSRFFYTKQSHSLSSCELILTGLLKLNHSNQLPLPLCLLWLSVIRSVILTLVQCQFLVKHSFFKAFCQSQQTSSCIPHSSDLRGADAFFGSCFTRRENSYKFPGK